jgi:hypothetical protein
MSGTLTLDLGLDLDRPAPEAPAWRRAPQEPTPPAAGPRERPTLDDVVVGAWEGLLAHRPAGCPVCGSALLPRPGSGAAAVGGRCRDCGTTLG